MLGSTVDSGVSMPSARQALLHRMIRRIGTSNPFYAISAVLVLLGLRVSCDPDGVVFPTWALLAGLAGYTLLLACTAAGLVRLLGVWEDVRTLLLLVVMILTAIPAFFDDLLAREARTGISCELGGLAFAFVTSEALLRAIRLRLPAWYRIAYHLLIALFFLHPILVASASRNPSSPSLLWLLLGFPTAFGAGLLILLPAIRRGPSYVADNGCPWRWPLYPWSLFAILGLAAVARTFSVCLSVNYSAGTGRYEGIYDTIFGPYFLIPPLFVAALLILEAGLVTKRRVTQVVGLAIPAGLVVLSTLGHRTTPSYERLLLLFREDLGATPLFLTLAASGLFYGVAALRRVRGAVAGLSSAMAAMIVIGPSSLTFFDCHSPQPVPLAAFAMLQVVMASLHRASWRASLAGFALAAASFQAVPLPGLLSLRIYFALHVLLACFLAIIIVFNDGFSRFLRKVAATMLGALVVASVLGQGPPIESPDPMRTYPLSLLAIAAATGWYLGDATLMAVVIAGLAAWLIMLGWQGYEAMRRTIIGLNQILAGLFSFALAAAISLWKAGVWRRRADGASISKETHGLPNNTTQEKLFPSGSMEI